MWRVIGIIVGIFSSLSSASRPHKPNILYILADDMGFGDVSWNNPDMKTPVLERLAREGVILDQFYAQPKCSPSRAALMTGLYPYKTSMQRGSIGPFRPTGLPTVLPTLPELLRQEGYSTHLVGKWHLGYCSTQYTPVERGFDTFFGEYAQQADHYTREHEINKHIGSGYDLWRGSNVSHDGSGLYSTRLWEEETISVLGTLNNSKPWFLELALTAVHPPYQVPERFMQMYFQPGRTYSQSQYQQDVIRKGMVSAIDESVGRVIAKLKTTGMYNNTLVIFTSDNGSGYRTANAPLRGKKGSVYEGGVRVPAFLHGPPLTDHMNAEPGYTSTALTHITDWFPTLLKLAGHNLTTKTDGVDLWPAISSGGKSARTSMVYNIDMDDQSETFQMAVRYNSWKLIWGQTKEFRPHRKQTGELSLFNLAEDPYEEKDLSGIRVKKLEDMKHIAKKLAEDLKIAFQPNRFNLGFPRYHSGLLEPGWCEPGWWDILWKNQNHKEILKTL
eukprot:TRINITY_DN21515_c0_g1_i1.p1 TRINITY_DN21515_c0_g1~~TRINITY_DN21515_c0_g1_i1.p1  ORF type:complete len:501 (-),score=111.45 TRINITY_DN21515_c0_g1_i1:46-1548(-)